MGKKEKKLVIELNCAVPKRLRVLLDLRTGKPSNLARLEGDIHPCKVMYDSDYNLIIKPYGGLVIQEKAKFRNIGIVKKIHYEENKNTYLIEFNEEITCL